MELKNTVQYMGNYVKNPSDSTLSCIPQSMTARCPVNRVILGGVKISVNHGIFSILYFIFICHQDPDGIDCRKERNVLCVLLRSL